MRVIVTSIVSAGPGAYPTLGWLRVELPDLGIKVDGVRVVSDAASPRGVTSRLPRYRAADGRWTPAILFLRQSDFLAFGDAVEAAWCQQEGHG